MSRQVFVMALVLGCSSVAMGQQVVSYHVDAPFSNDPPPTGSATVIEAVPTGGLVVTDIIVTRPATYHLYAYNGTDLDRRALVWNFVEANSDGTFRFERGIKFEAGETVKYRPVGGDGSTLIPITISGYIPGPSSQAAPAIGAWGVGVMALLVLAAGTVVFRRMVA